MSLVQRLLSRRRGGQVDLTEVNYTPEHVSLAKALERRRRIFNIIWDRIPLLRLLLSLAGLVWLAALPYEGLWKRTYIDENALQSAQVATYWDWADVHAADRHLDILEDLTRRNASFTERSEYLETTFAAAGLETASIPSAATYARVTPPRSQGLEAILISANWVSRDSTPNLRGVATLLAFGEFLRGQQHWAFDLILVVGEGYVSGLEGFMREYDTLYGARIWTGVNLDYPGHSFSHLGLFYEGVNGRLPNQDALNVAERVARQTGGVPVRVHNVEDGPAETPFEKYIVAARHLWEHLQFAALGRPSAAHGVLSRHRIDALTFYCTPATGPHGFHTLGRVLESTLRSYNNMLERLHASYFFYLLPRPGWFLPVGHYLPAAVLLGASITIGGFDCPAPLDGLLAMLPAFGIAWLGWMLQRPSISLAILGVPRPKGQAKRSAIAMTHLLYGAYIPTLAMVNFPQAILLAGLSLGLLVPQGWAKIAVLPFLNPSMVQVLETSGMDLRWEWETFGNMAWPGVHAVWVPLWCLSAMMRDTPI